MRKYLIIFLLMSFFLNANSGTFVLREETPDRIFSRQFPGLKFLKNEIVMPAGYTVNGKFFKFQNESRNQIIGYMYIGRVETRRSASFDKNENKSMDFFDYYILYDENLVINKVQILQYQSSHGEMISSPGWLKQFKGYSKSKSLEVGKQVDAISGATISVNNLTWDIKQKTLLLSEIADK